MLIRILSDNPGPTFTRNLDRKFVDRVKDLLRNPPDGNVRQILVETVGIVIQRPHFLDAVFQQILHDVGANEARAAGNEKRKIVKRLLVEGIFVHKVSEQ